MGKTILTLAVLFTAVGCCYYFESIHTSPVSVAKEPEPGSAADCKNDVPIVSNVQPAPVPEPSKKTKPSRKRLKCICEEM